MQRSKNHVHEVIIAAAGERVKWRSSSRSAQDFRGELENMLGDRGGGG